MFWTRKKREKNWEDCQCQEWYWALQHLILNVKRNLFSNSPVVIYAKSLVVPLAQSIQILFFFLSVFILHFILQYLRQRCLQTKTYFLHTHLKENTAPRPSSLFCLLSVFFGFGKLPTFNTSQCRISHFKFSLLFSRIRFSSIVKDTRLLCRTTVQCRNSISKMRR